MTATLNDIAWLVLASGLAFNAYGVFHIIAVRPTLNLWRRLRGKA